MQSAMNSTRNEQSEISSDGWSKEVPRKERGSWDEAGKVEIPCKLWKYLQLSFSMVSPQTILITRFQILLLGY